MSEFATSPVFIVTGASRGIGNAIVPELLRRGARVVGVARNSGASAAQQAEAASGNCHYLRADVTVEADRVMIVETTKRLFGRIDGVINKRASKTCLAVRLRVCFGTKGEVFSPEKRMRK